MKRQLRGIALLLLSILLTLGFAQCGWRYVFDLSLEWAQLFMLLGAAGAGLALWPEQPGSTRR